MSVVVTATRSRSPRANSWSMAGSRTSTVRPSRAPVTRMGAASWCGSDARPPAPTSYSLTNATMSSAPETRSRMVGAPVTRSGAPSGSESNTAVWPGMSNARPPRPPATEPIPGGPGSPDPPPPPPVSVPRPGSAEIDAGEPPGGFVTVCGPPSSAMVRWPVPPSPG